MSVPCVPPSFRYNMSRLATPSVTAAVLMWTVIHVSPLSRSVMPTAWTVISVTGEAKSPSVENAVRSSEISVWMPARDRHRRPGRRPGHRLRRRTSGKRTVRQTENYTLRDTYFNFSTGKKSLLQGITVHYQIIKSRI